MIRRRSRSSRRIRSDEALGDRICPRRPHRRPDDPPELDGHVVVGRFGLGGVPPGPNPVADHVVGCVSVQRVPDGDHAETDQAERHVRSTARRVRLRASPPPTIWRASAKGLLDSPPPCVTRHHVFRGRSEIGGHHGEPIIAIVTAASPRLIVANQNDPDDSAAKRAVPQTGDLSDLHGVGTPVAADPCGTPPTPGCGTGRQVGGSAQSRAAGAWSPRASGARRRQLVQHRGDL